jgi:hypothetical protein
LASGENKDPSKADAKADEDEAAEDSLKRAEYELLELVKQTGGLHIEPDSGLDSTSKIALVINIGIGN